MKHITKSLSFISIVFILILCLPVFVQAQPVGGCDPLDPGCPIDGGLSALLAIGVGYGIKKVRDIKRAGNNS